MKGYLSGVPSIRLLVFLGCASFGKLPHPYPQLCIGIHRDMGLTASSVNGHNPHWRSLGKVALQYTTKAAPKAEPIRNPQHKVPVD